MTIELRRGFHDRLAGLHEQVQAMGRVVVDGVRDATAALLAGDPELGAEVVARDRAIDEAYPWVEHEVFDVVAREAPVARDLRFVIASVRVAANIERCGDLVASIARRAERVGPSSSDEHVRGVVLDMSAAARETFERAMESYAVLDEELALSVASLDRRVDELQRDLLRRLVATTADVEAAIDLAMIARFYERVGDHGLVIAERARFVAVGEMDAGDRNRA